MIYAVILLFAVAAGLGLTLFIHWLREKDASSIVIYSHGLAAATALVLLIVYAVQHPDNFPKTSIILFAIAAVGGAYLFIRNKANGYRSVAIASVHALLALSGFVALLLYAFS